jgi:uncharacterized DUF497 family protein
MPWYFFHWDEENIQHVADHGITQAEFEEMVMDPERVEPSRSSGRPIAFGETSTGKYLACVFEMLDEATVDPITAFEIES